MNTTVLVVENVWRKAEAIFRSTEAFTAKPVPTEEGALAEAVLAEGARAVVLGTASYRGPLYEALAQTGGPSGAILARFGVGHDGVDKDMARKNRIVVTNTPGVLNQSVAEHAIWLLGALARRVARADAQFHAGRFAPEMGIELAGKTLGILGLGGIGRSVARLARFGFGMKVLAADCLSTEELERREGQPMAALLDHLGVEYYTCEPETIFDRLDVLSLHLPATDATRDYLNTRRLALLKPGALVINTARGALVDENALFGSLATGHLGGAALDVFQKEPYEPLSPDKDLRTLDNVVLTPHIGSNTREANDRMARACLDNLAHFFAGRLEELSRVDEPVG